MLKYATYFDYYYLFYWDSPRKLIDIKKYSKNSKMKQFEEGCDPGQWIGLLVLKIHYPLWMNFFD